MHALKQPMKAVLVKEIGGPEHLYIGTYEKPTPQKNELLIKILYAGINRLDILQRQGKYPLMPDITPILGVEAAGIVQEIGAECTDWKKGDRVMALLPGGGYAQYCVVHEKIATPIPENLSFEQAAGIPEAFLTAYQALFWLGNLQPNQDVLIHAAASGVGTAAIQLAKDIGATCHVTAGSTQKLEHCQNLGAKTAINYKETGGHFAKKVLEATSGKGVNLILDFVGASYFEQNLECCAMDSRIIFLGTLGGTQLPQGASIGPILSKRISVIGSTLRYRPFEYKSKLANEFYNYSKDKFSKGILKSIIDRIFRWSDVAEAHKFIESSSNVGKVILKIED